jgi:hypothetical protein
LSLINLAQEEVEIAALIYFNYWAKAAGRKVNRFCNGWPTSLDYFLDNSITSFQKLDFRTFNKVFMKISP